MAITRLAPSPTGALHLGNARTFLINWILARQCGWQIVLRIEDLDGPRIKKNADQQAIQDLLWLGIDWDQGPVYQSTRMPIYQQAIDRLIDSGLAYPCICTRKDATSAASAPHAEDGSAVYPGTCRGRFATVEQAQEAAGRPPAIRFIVPDQTVMATDLFCGAHRWQMRQELGDFVIAKSDGLPAYQLAVVVDDAQMEIDQVVRGDDLLDSTPRQMLLYRALGWEDRIPSYYHLPLVKGTDGRRLAKRHGDTRLAYYRQRGVSPGRILALLARWCGIELDPQTASARQFLERFDLARVPRQPIVFGPADDQWLMGERRS